MAEIIKYGLSYDADLYKLITESDPMKITDFEPLIYRSVEIKNEVVLEDPTEKNLRKVLNFGHSLGHAIESYFLIQKDKLPITHGEAVAAGMVMAAHLSHQNLDLPIKDVEAIKAFIITYFGKLPLAETDFSAILKLLKHDKKAENGLVKFILIKAIGTYKLNCEVSESAMIKALNYYCA
jgi:3-dehydroquinate synthase